MSRRCMLAFVVATVALLGAPAGARAQGGEPAPVSVPKEYRPPPGMCRIWLAEVPPAKQPAPTDCTSAVRSRPPNGQVIFGDKPKSSRSGSWVDGIKALKDRTSEAPRPPIRQLREPSVSDTAKVKAPATPKPKPPEPNPGEKPPIPVP